MLRDSREGIPLNKAEFYDMDAKLSAAIRSGQHMYQALQSSDVEIAISTAYKYANKGYFSFTSLDLPRMETFFGRMKNEMYYGNDRIQPKTKWMPPVDYREASIC